jgi:hypothetical protein
MLFVIKIFCLAAAVLFITLLENNSKFLFFLVKGSDPELDPELFTGNI